MNRSVSNNINQKHFFNISSISKYYNWNPEYTAKVIFEYKRFLTLRVENSDLSPSDDIDKLWHYHILDTKSYYTYCIEKFGKIIHHNPADSLNQKLRQIRLANTHVKYLDKFGSFENKQVWNISKDTTHVLLNDDIKLDTLQKFELPDYKSNTVSEPNVIKIFLYYTFDNGYFTPKELLETNCYFKKWRPNEMEYDKKILTLKIDKNTTMNLLKKYIEHITGHAKIAIRLYPHPSYRQTLNTKQNFMNNMNTLNNKYNNNSINGCQTFASNYLNIINKVPDDDDKSLMTNTDNSFKFYIGELVEMTQNGFC